MVLEMVGIRGEMVNPMVANCANVLIVAVAIMLWIIVSPSRVNRLGTPIRSHLKTTPLHPLDLLLALVKHSILI